HGTDKLESSLPMPVFIGSGNTSAPFTLNVPSKVPSFDLFASAIDLAQGATDPYPGHTIEVLSGQAPPAASATSTAVLPDMQCVGHGSIFGPASSSTPDSGTAVELSKGGVQLMSTTVGPLPPAAAPSQGIGYEFCVPPEGAAEPDYVV